MIHLEHTCVCPCVCCHVLAQLTPPSTWFVCVCLCVCESVWLCACVLLMTSRTILFHPISALSGTNFGFFDFTWFALHVSDGCWKAKMIRMAAVRVFRAKFDTAIYTSWFTTSLIAKHISYVPFVRWNFNFPSIQIEYRQAGRQAGHARATFNNMRKRVFGFHDEFK